MKPILKEFYCPQCGKICRINVNGICFDCKNENTLSTLAIQRKLQQKLNSSYQILNIESLN
ncbi:MAG: hypothetical protein ACW986_08070 [Promethearchaeota archaeon]